MQPINDNDTRQLRSLATGCCLVLLALHYYYYCYQAFAGWGLTHPIIDRLVTGFARSGLFRHPTLSKSIALAAAALNLAGRQAPIQVKSTLRLTLSLVAGALLYFASDLLLTADRDPAVRATAYILSSLTGLYLLYTGIRSLSSLITWPASNSVFNQYNESYPQQEQRISNPFSIHFKAQYNYRGQVRSSIINEVDIFRGTIILGVPGSGKTRYIFRQSIQQSLANGMALFVFDLKYDDLTRLTYNSLQRIKHTLPVQPTFYSINFDDFSRSHRCNPLDPMSLDDISDARESAQTILVGLNRRWAHLAGDFWVESAISFFTANIWFLRTYEGGKYCTLAHLIELIQTDFYKLFSILRSVPEAETLVMPFVSALVQGHGEQLQGQVDSARIGLSTLSSPQLYYLLSDNDFTLDLNNPKAPKVICLGSNPQKQHVYGAVIGLYISRMQKLVNRKGGHPCHLLYDEFASLPPLALDIVLSQARSNKVAVTFGVQDLSQMRSTYGRDQADALFNLPGNLICGQVSGDSARLVSERFGRILQDKSSVSSNSRDTSTNQSQHLDLALPPSKIATFSSGEFCGITADTPTQPLPLKAFHARFVIDHHAIQKEEATYQPIPQVRTVTPDIIDLNFRRIKQEARQLVEDRLAYMAATPALAGLIVTKKPGPNQHQQSGP
jgi:hypothetical protein